MLLTLGTPSPSPAQSAPHVLYESEQADAERWYALHRSYVARARAGNVPLLFLGDSLMYGWLVDGIASWKAAFVPLGAEDFGIGGDRTSDIVWRIRHGELDGISPRLAVLSIGTNDLGQGRGVDATVAGVAACLRAIHLKLPETRVVLIGILPRGGGPSEPIRRAVAAANARLARLADGKRVLYYDSGATFIAPGGTLRPELYHRDRLHLSGGGYRAWAGVLRPKVAALMRPSS